MPGELARDRDAQQGEDRRSHVVDRGLRDPRARAGRPAVHEHDAGEPVPQSRQARVGPARDHRADLAALEAVIGDDERHRVGPFQAQEIG